MVISVFVSVRPRILIETGTRPELDHFTGTGLEPEPD